MSSSNLKSHLDKVALDLFSRRNYIGGDTQLAKKFNKNNIGFNLHMRKISERITP